MKDFLQKVQSVNLLLGFYVKPYRSFMLTHNTSRPQKVSYQLNRLSSNISIKELEISYQVLGYKFNFLNRINIGGNIF